MQEENCTTCGKKLTCLSCRTRKARNSVKNHVRGDSAYYSKLGKKGMKKRWENHKKLNPKIICQNNAQ